jgi:hypothetical protein
MRVIDVAEILEHWHAGRKMVELSTSLCRTGPRGGRWHARTSDDRRVQLGPV